MVLPHLLRLYRPQTQRSVRLRWYSINKNVRDHEYSTSKSSRRVRQHVNPLQSRFREPMVIPDWNTLFKDPSLPIHIDIGCARGKYLLDLAPKHATSLNFLGIEIRDNVVQAALHDLKKTDIQNLAFVHANFNFQLPLLLPALPSIVHSVSIYHPDPWFKKKHHKRRLVVPSFVKDLGDHLPHDTVVDLQTDVEELHEDMVEVFSDSKSFASCDEGDHNLFNQPTDRELAVRQEGGSIYRARFRKSTQA